MLLSLSLFFLYPSSHTQSQLSAKATLQGPPGALLWRSQEVFGLLRRLVLHLIWLLDLLLLCVCPLCFFKFLELKRNIFADFATKGSLDALLQTVELVLHAYGKL